MRRFLPLLAVIASGCALEAADNDPSDHPSSNEQGVACAIRITGQITALGEPAAGAFVIARDAAGLRLAQAMTDANGFYYLPVCSEPSEVRVKGWDRAPQRVGRADFLLGGPNEYEANADLGPSLESCMFGRVLTYVAKDSPTDVALIPQVGWAPAAIGGAADALGDLLRMRARLPHTSSLVPDGTEAVPNVEQAVLRRSCDEGDYVEVRLSEEANSQVYGSAYEATHIGQWVATTCMNQDPEERLPVRILVRCADCPDGWTTLQDGHLGPDAACGSYSCATLPTEQAFSDTAGQRYAHEIAVAKALDIATGYADGTFRPANLVTRAEFVSMMVSALGLPLPATCTPPFPDVAKSSWYCKTVAVAKARGLTGGYPDGTFKPSNPVTRAELASYVAAAGKWPVVTQAVAHFSDVPPSYWAHKKVETAWGWRRTVEPRSVGSSLFEPREAATRAEAAAAVVRTLECLVGNEPQP